MVSVLEFWQIEVAKESSPSSSSSSTSVSFWVTSVLPAKLKLNKSSLKSHLFSRFAGTSVGMMRLFSIGGKSSLTTLLLRLELLSVSVGLLLGVSSGLDSKI